MVTVRFPDPDSQQQLLARERDSAERQKRIEDIEEFRSFTIGEATDARAGLRLALNAGAGARGETFLEASALQVTAHALASDLPRLAVGQSVGSYEIQAPLGTGAKRAWFAGRAGASNMGE